MLVQTIFSLILVVTLVAPMPRAHGSQRKNKSLIAPTDLSVVAESDSQLKLTCNDTNTWERSYFVERSLDGKRFSVVKVLDANSTSYTDSFLDSGKTYYYRVRAKGKWHGSSYSVVATGTPAAPLLELSGEEAPLLKNGD